MRNPYAKPLAKRPRPDIQDAPSVQAETRCNEELDQSFGASELDWSAAVQLLDQASQSYQRNGTKVIEEPLKKNNSLQSHGRNEANSATAAPMVVTHQVSNEMEGSKPDPDPLQSSVAAEHKPAPTGTRNIVNPYRRVKPTSTTIKMKDPDTRNTQEGVSIQIGVTVNDARVAEPSSTLSETSVIGPSIHQPESMTVPPAKANIPLHLSATNVSLTKTASSPVVVTSVNATSSHKSQSFPAHTIVPVQLSDPIFIEPAADVTSDEKLSSARPASCAPGGAVTLGTNIMASSRPSSSKGAESIQPKATFQRPSSAQSGNQPISSHPARLVPLPPSWGPNSAAAASIPGNIASSRPSSSQGQQARNDSAQSTGLPVALNYSVERVQPINDEYRARLVKNANLSAPLLNGWTLFSHQKKAILRALLMRRFILALDMGLGKTLIGCVWAKAFQQTFADELKIFVVCPVSLKNEWKRTAEEATGLQVDDDNAQSTSMEICSWAKVPSEVSPLIPKFVVVFDEAHSMQSLQAARTKEALQLVKSQRCVGVLMLTGTPMKNGKPSNLFPLLKAVRHPFGDHQKAYESHFCAGKEKSFGRGRVVWDANGSSNLVQLRQHVASHMLHMTKEECLEELPPKTRVFRQVPVSSRHQLQHNQALNELAKVYATSGNFENSGDLILTAVQRVRQIGSFAKIDATVALAKDVLQDQPAVVIFSSFATVAKTLHRQLSESGWEGELLTGETPAKKRQGMVDNFQAGLSPVFVSTFGAGGVGLTLTAAHTVILLDRPWTPGEAQQAEDRVRRIGQTNPVKSIWMVAFDLDKQIDGLLEQKSNTASVVLKEGNDNVDTSSAPKISVFQLLKSLLGNQQNASKIGVTTQINDPSR